MPRGKNKGKHVKYRKDRECWEVVEYVGGKLKRHATGFSSRSDAEERLAEEILQTHKFKEETVTLGEIMVAYITEYVPTLENTETVLKCFDRLIPFWGDLKLADIRESVSLKYAEYRDKEYKAWQKQNHRKTSRKLSPATIAREIEQLQAAISSAYKKNLISVNPYVWRPAGTNSRKRWLTKTEAAKILNEARKYERVRDYLPLYILIGIHTGARAEAISKLRWTDIDFNANRIDFTRIYGSKNKRGAIIPIPRRLKTHLVQARRKGVEMGYVVHRNQHRVDSVKNALKTVCERAGVKDVTSHTFRHTAASWRIQNGQSASKVAKFLGHSTTQMVDRYYGHLAQEHLEDTADAY